MCRQQQIPCGDDNKKGKCKRSGQQQRQQQQQILRLRCGMTTRGTTATAKVLVNQAVVATRVGASRTVVDSMPVARRVMVRTVMSSS
jgi:hypothetical protein